MHEVYTGSCVFGTARFFSESLHRKTTKIYTVRSSACGIYTLTRIFIHHVFNINHKCRSLGQIVVGNVMCVHAGERKSSVVFIYWFSNTVCVIPFKTPKVTPTTEDQQDAFDDILDTWNCLLL